MYLQHRNKQMLHINILFIEEPVIQYSPAYHLSRLVDLDSSVQVVSTVWFNIMNVFCATGIISMRGQQGFQVTSFHLELI